MLQPSNQHRAVQPSSHGLAGHLRSTRSLPCIPDLQTSFSSCHQDLSCPVCLQIPNFPVHTNCGHLFCAPCLISYWKHGTWLEAISCPLCRQKVSVLCLFGDSRSDRQSKEISVEINDYNKRYSGAPRRVTDYLGDTPLLLRRALGSVGWLILLFLFRVVLCCVGALLSSSAPYLNSLSSPASLLNEDAPLQTSPVLQADAPLCGLLGMLDDLVVVTLLLICIFNINQQVEPNTRGEIAT